jgi:hypothetical protein
MKIPILLALLLPASAWACLHFDRNWKYEVKEGTQHAFLFHDGQQAHLVINADLSAPKGQLPPRLAWVLPFPAMPTAYRETAPDFFEQLGTRFHQQDITRLGEGRALPAGQKSAAKIQVHATRKVGGYRIHPIEILDAEAGTELDAWLTRNQFNPMPRERQAPYLRKGTVFLAVEMDLRGKQKADLRPLHVTYPARNLTLPLRFTHDTRRFDLELWVFTPYNLDTPHRTEQSQVPALLARVDETFYDGKGKGPVGDVLGQRTGYVYKFQGRDLNGPGRELASLKSDPLFVPQ